MAQKSTAQKADEGSTPTDELNPLDEQAAKACREAIGDDRVVEMYRDMMLVRRFEEQAGRAYQMGKIKGFCHLYIGQEPVAVGSIATLEERDYVVAAYREHGHAIARGMSPDVVMAELFGKADGCSKGKGGSMHLFDTDINFYGGWGIVGGQIPTAAGVGFAAKYREEDAVCLCYFGEGSIHQGVFHETLNMASKWDLPVVFITENNKYAMGTDIARISAIQDIQKKALSYGMDHAKIDGKDIFKVWAGVNEAVERARNESRPTFLDIVTYRYRGHSMSDPAQYRTKDEVEAQMAQDPIARMRKYLIDEGVSDEASLDEIEEQAKADAKASVKFADNSPMPDPSELETDIYVEWPFDIE